MDNIILEVKICKTCGLSKPLDQFRILKRNLKNGPVIYHHTTCKYCISLVNKQYYKKVKDTPIYIEKQKIIKSKYQSTGRPRGRPARVALDVEIAKN